MLIQEGIINNYLPNDTSSLPSLGNLKGLSLVNFTEFASPLLDRMKLSGVITKEKLFYFETHYQRYYEPLLCLLYLQKWSGLVIERLILLDRLLFLLENNYNAKLINIFDSIKSPRSYAIIAEK
jgi:hypothetical protein